MDRCVDDDVILHDGVIKSKFPNGISNTAIKELQYYNQISGTSKVKIGGRIMGKQ
jgi:hypothetical protein